MRKMKLAVWIAVGTLLLAAPLFALDNPQQGRGEVVVTVLGKHGGEAPASISRQDLKIEVNGKPSSVTNWVSLRGAEDNLELVLLIDSGAGSSMGKQMGDMAHFIQSLPPNVRSAIAYMESGRAVLASPLTADHEKVLRGLHLTGNIPSASASPYFCLSDLAKRWPSEDRKARRVVVMVTNGVDSYNPHYDPMDPYVQSAISDSVRAGLVVYSIYWRGNGFRNRTLSSGQNLLNEVTEATGGYNYWTGSGDPVSFEPYFKNLTHRLQNQYRLSFVAGMKGESEIESLKLKFKVPGTEINAPEQVFVGHGVGE